MKKEWLYQERAKVFGGGDWITLATYDDEAKAKQDWMSTTKVSVDARLIERSIKERIVYSYYDDRSR